MFPGFQRGVVSHSANAIKVNMLYKCILMAKAAYYKLQYEQTGIAVVHSWLLGLHPRSTYDFLGYELEIFALNRFLLS